LTELTRRYLNFLRTGDRVAAALFVVALAAGYAQFGAVASLDDVAKHFGHVTDSGTIQGVVGLSGTIIGLGLAVLRLSSLGALPLSSLADRWGRKRVLRQIFTTGLIVTSFAALSPSYWFFVACFAFARPLLSASSTLIQVMTVELSITAVRARRLAFIAAGAGIGAGLAAVLHGLIRGPNSFRWLFASALIFLLSVRPLLKIIPESAINTSTRPSARIGAVPRDLWFRLFVVSMVAATIGIITGPANGFAFVYGEGVLKLSPHLVAFVVTLSAFTGLLGLILGRRLADRIGRRWTTAIGVLGSALTSTFAYSGGRSSFIVGYMVGVTAAGLLAPAVSALATEVFPESFRATTGGWFVVAGVIGGILGLAVFGYVSDSVHTTLTINALRVPALVTFLPLLPSLLLLRYLPETKDVVLSST
jgi:MFS family permease